MILSRPKSTIRYRRETRRVDLFGAILLFVMIALPVSLLYQISAHYFGDNPAIAVVDMLRASQH